MGALADKFMATGMPAAYPRADDGGWHIYLDFPDRLQLRGDPRGWNHG